MFGKWESWNEFPSAVIRLSTITFSYEMHIRVYSVSQVLTSNDLVLALVVEQLTCLLNFVL